MKLDELKAMTAECVRAMSAGNGCALGSREALPIARALLAAIEEAEAGLGARDSGMRNQARDILNRIERATNAH